MSLRSDRLGEVGGYSLDKAHFRFGPLHSSHVAGGGGPGKVCVTVLESAVAI